LCEPFRDITIFSCLTIALKTGGIALAEEAAGRVSTVSFTNSPETLGPIGDSADQAVEVLATEMHIRELCIERPSIIAYLQTIPAGKQTIALVHALEVGVTEMIARRERFKH
jgi:hypothetical protein